MKYSRTMCQGYLLRDNNLQAQSRSTASAMFVLALKCFKLSCLIYNHVRLGVFQEKARVFVVKDRFITPQWSFCLVAAMF